MTILEIAVYAALLGGASPVTCHLDETAVARCSNGLDAEQLSRSEIAFSNGVTVQRAGDRFPAFSNGLRSWWGSSGWLQFSNGIAIRRLSATKFVFDNGLVCETALPELIECVRAKAERAP
ncbi:MAG: hypothetical protein JO010_03865 [Alphaproteobacteria bacterium]|nr:hypothetical protein [Alphaproteobacteria bacterium]